MNKQEFLTRLREALSGLPREDAEERLAFYNEMIDDRVEDGLTEEEAVAEIGPVDKVVSQILTETPLPKLVQERFRSNRSPRVWEIILLVLGAPVWLPLLLSAVVVLFSVYIVIWSVIISLWAAEISFVAGAVGGSVGGIWLFCRGDGTRGALMIAAALVCAGLALFGFFGCMAITKGAVLLTRKIALWIKSLFLRKERQA